MNTNLLEDVENNSIPHLLFNVDTGEILRGNMMARAFYSIDTRKVTVYDILLGINKEVIGTRECSFIENIITIKANGMKYSCVATLDMTDSEKIIKLKVELVKDCLVKPMEEDMLKSKFPEVILLNNSKLNVYSGNQHFYNMIDSNVENFHKVNKNSFLNIVPKKSRKYLLEQIKKHLFSRVDILQVKITLKQCCSQVLTFQKISNKIHCQMSNCYFTQEDVMMIGKNTALFMFELNHITDFGTGMSVAEQENFLLQEVSSRLRELTVSSQLFGKLDTFRYSFLMELSYYSADMRSRQVQAVLNYILDELSENYHAKEGFLKVKISIGYVLCPEYGTDYDILEEKCQKALDCAKCLPENLAMEYTRVLEGIYGEE